LHLLGGFASFAAFAFFFVVLGLVELIDCLYWT